MMGGEITVSTKLWEKKSFSPHIIPKTKGLESLRLLLPPSYWREPRNDIQVVTSNTVTVIVFGFPVEVLSDLTKYQLQWIASVIYYSL